MKKPVDRRGRPEYRYKTSAIQECSRHLATTLNDNWLREATVVPVPPSKDRLNPLYDDRVTAMCRGIGGLKPYAIDIRELVEQQTSIQAAHENPDNRPSPEDLRRIYRIDERIVAPPPKAIGIIDDVLTAGSHFRAMKDILAQRFPGVPICGVFIARRVFPDDEKIEVSTIADLLR